MVEVLSGAQIRGARAMLEWSMSDLANVAGLSISTVKRLQDGTSVDDATLAAVQRAFETEGIRFLQDDGDGPGVRARTR